MGFPGGVVPGFRHLRLEQIRRAFLNHPLVAERARADGFIHRARGLPIEPFEVMTGFGRDHLVPLACQHVEGGLRADDLTRRRDEGGIAEVFPDCRHFLEHGFDLVQGILLGELRGQIGQHAPGNLRDQDLRIDTGSRDVRRGSAPIELTPKEYAVLEYLARNPGRVTGRRRRRPVRRPGCCWRERSLRYIRRRHRSPRYENCN